MIRKVLEMANRNEIRNAHEIVDKIESIYEREALRKLLPPRPEVTFGETIEELRGLASADDVHLWKIISRLDRFEKSYSATPVVESKSLPFENVPEGSLAVADGSYEVWRKGQYFWETKGTNLALVDEKMESAGFKILRWGWVSK